MEALTPVLAEYCEAFGMDLDEVLSRAVHASSCR